jgi:uncharacterized membrane protein YfcA
LEFSFIGLFVGILAGFFGIGGGTVLVPMLLFLGFGIKEAIGVSVFQMFFTSLFGTFLNWHAKLLAVRSIIGLLVGAALGALLSPYVVQLLPEIVLKLIFILFVSASIVKLMSKNPQSLESSKQIASYKLFFIGLLTAMFSIAIGVGGALIMVPVLHLYLHYSMKQSVAMGLFFVVISSFLGLVSYATHGMVDYATALPITLFSILGVTIGVKLSHNANEKWRKKLLIIMYMVILIFLISNLV